MKRLSYQPRYLGGWVVEKQRRRAAVMAQGRLRATRLYLDRESELSDICM